MNLVNLLNFYYGIEYIVFYFLIVRLITLIIYLQVHNLLNQKILSHSSIGYMSSFSEPIDIFL